MHGIVALVALTGTLIAAEPAGIGQVAWLAGCWQMDSAGQTVEERWTPPRAGSMLGTSRTVRGGALTGYEFVLLHEKDGSLLYEAHPSGQAGDTFPARDLNGTRVIFENLAHDFPQRIGYEQRGADGLLAWIEGTVNGRTRRVDFTYRRVACP